MRKWLTKLFSRLTPILPKLVICFRTGGCMDTEREFKWIGYVTRTYEKDNPSEYKGKVFHSYTTMYEVQPLIYCSSSEYIENRDKKLSRETAYQLQHLGFNLYIHYI